MKKYSFFILVSCLAAFSSCKKDDETTVVLEAKTVSNLNADASNTGHYTLFNFQNNAEVALADSATNKWDIGFKGTTIIVNGGAIRVGQGGAYIHTGLFDELAEIPTTATFATDASVSSLAITTGSGNGWYNYDPATNIISPIAGKVLVIKTGDGKYAKVEILSYYQNAPATPTATDTPRYYKFRYIYQPDGSLKF